MLPIPSVKVEGEFFLGNHPHGLAELSRTVLQKTTPGRLTDRLNIPLQIGWCDFALLAYLAQIINIARNHFGEINLYLPPTEEKTFSFLWRCGFWTYVRANTVGSPLYCHPDNWQHQPNGPRDTSLNFTQIFHLDLDSTGASQESVSATDAIVADFVKRFDDDLRSMACFPLVAKTDAMQTREYLYLLLWELVHNSFIHSGSKDVAIAAQVFVSPQDLKRPQGEADSTLPLDSMSRQYRAEVSNTRLSERKRWLSSHSMQSFLLLACTDCGKGIPQSMRSQPRNSTLSDDQTALRTAFSPWSSSRRTDLDIFDMHGLSQVVRLVDDYDGYLFVQSGKALLESSRSVQLQPAPIKEGQELAGTLFQILLPLTPKPPARSKHTGVFGIGHAGPDMAEPQKRTVFVAGEIRRAGFDAPPMEEDWPHAAKAVCLAADRVLVDPLYLDLTGMPCDRQFVSYILRTVRRNRPHGQGVVAINVPLEIAGFARAMQKLDENASEKDFDGWQTLEQDLATALSRGDSGCLRLLLPLVLYSAEGSPSIIWLGLGDLARKKRAVIESALTHLLVTDGAQFTWENLFHEVRTSNSDAALSLDEFSLICHAIARCNSSLFERSETGCSCRLSLFELERFSLASLEAEVRKLIPKMRHERGPGQQTFLYSLAWHDPDKRFRKEFYRTWTVLQDSRQRHVCAMYLAQKAYFEVGNDIGAAAAVITATPSAGLLGRELAALLGIPFYETTSIYDIDRRPWIPSKLNGPAIVVDDVIDTGALSKKLIAHLGARGCTCVIALLDNAAGRRQRDPLPVPLMTGMQIDLGMPTDADVEKAIQGDLYFEVDPHTLEPLPPRTGTEGLLTKEQTARLSELAHAVALPLGHFVQGEHHYKIYFSLADALASEAVQHSLMDWVSDQIRSFAEQYRTKRITIVYPYYSPIYKLVSRLQIGLSTSSINIDYVVAKPRQLTGNRTGYSLSSQESQSAESLRHVIVLDDGLASGGTLAAILDELLLSNSKALRALILFDRIGQQPRRHLHSIKSYLTADEGEMTFSFESYLKPNLRSHYRSDCPECKIRRTLEDTCRNHSGILASAFESLNLLLSPIIVSSERAPVSSALDPSGALSVLSFHHAALSDRPSPREIQRALEGRRGSPRLECLKTVLADEKIFRQIIDYRQLRSWIRQDVSDPSLAADARSRFVLALTACLEIDPVFVEQVLALDLPEAYCQLAAAEGGASDSRSVARHFDTHRNEFNAIAAALYLTYLSFQKRQVTEDARAKLLVEWNKLLRSDSFYGFPLETLFLKSSELPAVAAEHLIADFIGSRSFHEDSFRCRLSDVRQVVNNGMPERARVEMPPPLLRYLCSLIDNVQTYFKTWKFTDSQLGDLRDSCSAWQETDAAIPSADLITDYFLSVSPPATISLLLSEIAPRVARVLDVALTLHPAVRRQPADESVRVLGNAVRLERVVSNLVKNANDAWSKYQTASGPVDALDVQIFVRLDDPQRVTIEVADNSAFRGDIEAFFVAGGCLEDDRLHVQSWGGRLHGVNREHGGAKMMLELRRVVVVRDLGDSES